MSDFRIFLEDLEIDMYLGVHQFEQDAPQRVLLSAEIDISIDLSAAGLHFDYDLVAEHMRGFNGERVATQEELTARIHAFIVALDHVRHARVRSRKPDVYADCRAVGVEFAG